MKATLTAALALLILASCSSPSPPPQPVNIDPENDSCSYCRMPIWSAKTAGQLAAPGAEPRSFDDLGCLAGYLLERREVPPGARAYVVDHHTGAWVKAEEAVYTKATTLETPMGSHLVAHADEASRRADPVTAGFPSLTAREVFAPVGLPGDRP